MCALEVHTCHSGVSLHFHAEGTSECYIVRNNCSGSETDQIPVREHFFSNSNNFAKRGLLESLQKIKQEIPASTESKERKVHQHPRILSRTRTYQVKAYSLTKLDKERLDEADGGQCSIEEVQARLKSSTGSVPQSRAVKADGSLFIEGACRTSCEITDSTSLTNINYSSNLDLSRSSTERTEGLPLFHEVDVYSDQESTDNRQCAQNILLEPSHYADFRGVHTSRREPTERVNRQNHARPALLNRPFGANTVSDEERGQRPYRSRGLNLDERRCRFRSQVWALQRLSSSVEGVPGHIRPHARRAQHDSLEPSHGTMQTSTATDTRASISRIIMLAEALFQVLDEIHRQSSAVSQSEVLSLAPLRAPDLIVESIPMKLFREVDSSKNKEEQALQCHICLVDYEEGDCLRVLPCSHEYHMTCIDKWLKEVHRVCPLCRRDVCDLPVVE
ncbi:hypothetical protein GOP47_0025800 [Adiantum capillus-veneris]|uniref:RING-type domain-containing protein n=1 Tax=Adiantum capillus-veneris TaxID=13818 RepID=A0A9D4U0S2_ADICA|nr:hypothetical protein GOP47_0025800 [Adiantum capillus-veneris]